MCRVSWCSNKSQLYKNGTPKPLCKTHSQYVKWCSNAAYYNKEYLMYKVEKFVKGEHQCEDCGFDPIKSYPDLPSKTQSSMLDTDHIDSSLKGTIEGELPPNLQLLCKHCHIKKSHREKDNVKKSLRNRLK